MDNLDPLNSGSLSPSLPQAPAPSKVGVSVTVNPPTPTTPPTEPKPDIQWPAKKKNKNLTIIGGVLAILLVIAVAIGFLQISRRLSGTAVPTAPKINPFASETTCVDDTEDGICDTSSNTRESLDEAAEAGKCIGQVKLKINYLRTDCIPGRPCQNVTKKTSVGWTGGSNGSPKETYDDNAEIPLTTPDGEWIKDKIGYRSSDKIDGLGLFRLGGGKIIVSHANFPVRYEDYIKPATRKSFQAIDANMVLIGDASVNKWINGSASLFPDKPSKNAKQAGVGVDFDHDGKISRAPNFNNIPNFPMGCGGDEIDWITGTKVWKHYTRSCWPGDDYIMSLTCAIQPTGTPTPTTAATSCQDVNVYKKVSSGYSEALTVNQIKALKINDTIKMSLKTNRAGQKARFRVSINGKNDDPVWFTNNSVKYVAGTGNKTIESNDYKIDKRGIYDFIGQVTKDDTATPVTWVTSSACRVENICMEQWLPAANTKCPTETVTQTDGCGHSRTVTGTKVCAAETTCVDMRIYKKTGTSYGTTPLSDAQIRALPVNSLIRMQVIGNKPNLKARFRVTVSGKNELPTWKAAKSYGTSTTRTVAYYSDYKLAKSGTYGFYANVSKDVKTVTPVEWVGSAACRQPSCIITSWTPTVTDTTCTDQKVHQTSNCGTTRDIVDGTKICTCTPTGWTPGTNTVCEGEEFTQTATNCSDMTRVSEGTKICTVAAPDLSMEKKAYRDQSGNSVGNYNLSTEIDKVSKDQVFVYGLTIKNNGNARADEVEIKDILKGDNQELLAFVDSETRCSFDEAARTVTCRGMSLNAGQSGTYTFRVKVSNSAVNGDVIKNTAVASYKDMPTNGEVEASYSLTISTVVGCDHSCTADSECTAGLSCDIESNKCRRPACADATTCNCPVADATNPPTGEETPEPIITARRTATARPQPTTLPETGILDFPGVAAFGGGLLLAIIGILLAL